MRSVLALVAMTSLLGACEKDPILMPDRQAMHFVVVDNGNDQVHMIDEIRGTSWTADVPPGARDIARWDEDEVLVSHSRGATRFDIETGQETWVLDRYTGINSAQPLEGGGVLLAGQYGQIIKVYNIDRFDEQVGERTLTGYLEMRVLRETKAGNLLFTTGEPWRIVELDGFTSQIWGSSLPQRGFQAERLENGEGEADDTTLASTDEDLRVLEIDRNGSVVHTWGGGAEVEKYGLRSFRGFSQLDGLMFVANWVGNDGEDGDAHVIAINDAGDIVWDWGDHDLAYTVTHVLALETYTPPQ